MSAHVCTHVHMNTNLYMIKCVNMHIHLQMYTNIINVYKCIDINVLHIYIYTYMCVRVHGGVCKHLCVDVYVSRR